MPSAAIKHWFQMQFLPEPSQKGCYLVDKKISKRLIHPVPYVNQRNHPGRAEAACNGLGTGAGARVSGPVLLRTERAGRRIRPVRGLQTALVPSGNTPRCGGNLAGDHRRFPGTRPDP